MCNTCFNAATKEDITGLDRLAEIVGGMENVRFRTADFTEEQIADMKATGNSCLCPVRIIDTLVLNGFKVWSDPEDTVWRGFFFEPVDQTSTTLDVSGELQHIQHRTTSDPVAQPQ